MRGTPIRIGVFAGLGGDDFVGPGAVGRFLEDLVALPQLGESLRIYAYPVVHAANFETATPSFRLSEYIINQIGCKVFVFRELSNRTGDFRDCLRRNNYHSFSG